MMFLDRIWMMIRVKIRRPMKIRGAVAIFAVYFRIFTTLSIIYRSLLKASLAKQYPWICTEHAIDRPTGRWERSMPSVETETIIGKSIPDVGTIFLILTRAKITGSRSRESAAKLPGFTVGMRVH